MILGIDLGTTNTLASYIKDAKLNFIDFDGSKLLPSVLALRSSRFLVGGEAKVLWTEGNRGVLRSLKSFIGEQKKIELVDLETGRKKSYETEFLYSKILERVKTEAETRLKEEVKDVVISVPAFFNDTARKKTIRSAELAGLNVLRLINEPTAAALGYGFYDNALSGHKILVYDLGGGTFDVSLLEINDGLVEIIASDGDRRLGGDDIDALLFAELRKYESDASLYDAERIKIELSRKESFSFGKFTIEREHFEALLSTLLYTTIETTKRAIYNAGLDTKDFTKILLVGGSTKIPYIKKILERELDIKVSSEIDPDLAVARGVGIQAGILAGESLNSMLLDVAPHSISIACVVEKEGRIIPNYCAKLIHKNTPIPCTVEENFSTLYDGQDNVKIAIYQGESDYEDDNLLLEEFKLNIDKDSENIKLRLSYDINGSLDIRVVNIKDESKMLKKIVLSSSLN